MSTAAQSSSSGPKPVLRPQAPKSIPLPCRSSTEVQYARTYPSTPALSPTSHQNHREPNTNPFFILNEETPTVLTRRLHNPPSPSTHTRRPTLSAEISLEHAFGDTRRDPGQAQESRPKKEGSVPSSVASCTSSRSQPEMTKSRKSRPKNRPRAMTSLPALETAGRSLHTPSFRSTVSVAETPSTSTAGSSISTPRNISISEIPLLNGHIGYAVDVFGLAALQPPRIDVRPRPRVRERASALTKDRSEGGSTQSVPNGLVLSARIASPARS
ncbi:unnamed protein product [Rhizoctonia solani]|uniref:Uncharacterized protein n=1 Tax=Rhizoctonia solani TaxID=456999 RepID=A0A8H2WKM2_9AGAM|nr:unnamed protein product [Rhizoctonia solani]